MFANDFGYQVIKTTDATFHGEIHGDKIRVSQHNLWEIELNAQTGIIESWKVLYTIELIKGDGILILFHFLFIFISNFVSFKRKKGFSFNVIYLLDKGNGHKNVLA